MSENVKKPIWKKWWFWAIVIIFVAIANSGNDTEPSIAQPTSSIQQSSENLGQSQEQSEQPQQSAAKPEQKTKESKEFKVGDVVQMGDYKLTVDEVKKSAGSDFDKPKDGMEYVILKVTIENGGSKNISYNPFDFKMSNSQGQITDKAFTIVDNNTALQSGELAPGGKVSGTIVFEEPKDDAKLQLQFTPNFWSSDTIKINLQ
ncbi:MULTISPECIES: DUF4352 domain-containing protein [Brevibacillus]|uniref:DUF4352 domain-containing protein n=1 Tax=Brevibacillus TaxID=55080 RepID=UPI00203BAEB1|nr:DUF4352 domain-containing protein [Brevibacillus borstelensis]MCM3589618.1 DUF4352 domain-containing protein [Brevibacillus borstelensis]